MSFKDSLTGLREIFSRDFRAKHIIGAARTMQSFTAKNGEQSRANIISKVARTLSEAIFLDEQDPQKTLEVLDYLLSDRKGKTARELVHKYDAYRRGAAPKSFDSAFVALFDEAMVIREAVDREITAYTRKQDAALNNLSTGELREVENTVREILYGTETSKVSGKPLEGWHPGNPAPVYEDVTTAETPAEPESKTETTETTEFKRTERVPPGTTLH